MVLSLFMSFAEPFSILHCFRIPSVFWYIVETVTTHHQACLSGFNQAKNSKRTEGFILGKIQGRAHGKMPSAQGKDCQPTGYPVLHLKSMRLNCYLSKFWKYDQHRKISILPKTTNRFNTFPITIPTQFSTDLERIVRNFIWEKQNPQISN